MWSRLESRLVATGLACSGLLLVTGLLASGVGAITCHQEAGSFEQAPHLCAAVGGGIGFFLPFVVPSAVVVTLMFASARARLVAYATVVFLAAQAAVFTMWALVAHGTLTY